MKKRIFSGLSSKYGLREVETVEFYDFTRAFKRFFWLIAAVTLISTASAWAVSAYALMPMYESKAMIIIGKRDDRAGTESAPAQNIILDSNSIRLFYNIAASQTIAESVIQRVGLDMTAKDMQDILQTRVDYNTGILNIFARTSSPELSQSIVRAFIDILSAQSGGSFLHVSIHTVDEPKLAAEPVSPNLALNMALSATGGMAAAMLLSVLLYLKEQSKTDIHALSKLPWLSVLGFFPHIGRRASLYSSGDKKTADAAKGIRANLQFLLERDSIKSVMITSPHPFEGKTTIAVSLAASMAQQKKRVLLIDCNADNPSFYKIGGATVGAKADNPYRTVNDHVVKTIDGLGIDAAIAPRHKSGINFCALRDFVQAMEQSYDLIVADCPCVLSNADTMTLSSIVKNVILLADYRLLAHRILEKSAQRLTQLNADILGIVINRMPAKKLF